jgi:FtsH-binding integral membrane protein
LLRLSFLLLFFLLLLLFHYGERSKKQNAGWTFFWFWVFAFGVSEDAADITGSMRGGKGSP